MSSERAREPGAPEGAAARGPGQPSEEELRAAYEAELSRVTSVEMMVQFALTLLTIGGRRLGAADRPPGGPGAPAAGERDLEQARDAIDGVRALLEILERRLPNELGPLREALSQLQMAYAREVRAGAAAPSAAASEPGGPTRPGSPPGESQAPPDSGSPGGQEEPRRPGPAESSGRLWVPGR